MLSGDGGGRGNNRRVAGGSSLLKTMFHLEHEKLPFSLLKLENEGHMPCRSHVETIDCVIDTAAQEVRRKMCPPPQPKRWRRQKYRCKNNGGKLFVSAAGEKYITTSNLCQQQVRVDGLLLLLLLLHSDYTSDNKQ